MFLIQCSTKLSVALTQLQETREKTYITNAKNLSGKMDFLPWSIPWKLGHLFLPPETPFFLYILLFDCETCQTHSGLTNWLWNRYWLEFELNRNSFYLNYNGIEKYFAELSGTGFTSYHWNEKSYSNWPSRCVHIPSNDKNNKYKDADVVDNIIMITEDTIVLIEETYCLKVLSMAFQYNFYFFI